MARTEAFPESVQPGVSALMKRIHDRSARVGVIGLGYVGLPLAQIFAGQGFATVGFDIDRSKVEALSAGRSYMRHIPPEQIQQTNGTGRFQATEDFGRLADMDAVLICVPTPLTRQREPDMSFITATAESVARHLRPGQLVVLESSTFPGTTTDVLLPILETSGLVAGRDFWLAYSPEREDPGNRTHHTAGIPKVVGGMGAEALALASALYEQVVVRVVPVSSTGTAEAVKLTENIFRAVNIALVNELKVIFTAMDIDVWEVLEAAKSKPFGFMPFYPGPGLGGHCVPIDPFYLTWKAREYQIATRFIELAGEINTAMPRWVVARLADALNDLLGKPLRGARLLVIGIAYKKNVDDSRESPGLRIIELLEAKGAEVSFHDGYIPVIPPTREHSALAGRRSAALDRSTLAGFDAALIATDHDDVDYALLAEVCPIVLDTRNAMARRGFSGERIVKA